MSGYALSFPILADAVVVAATDINLVFYDVFMSCSFPQYAVGILRHDLEPLLSWFVAFISVVDTGEVNGDA